MSRVTSASVSSATRRSTGRPLIQSQRLGKTVPRCRSRGTLGKGYGQRDHNLLTEALSWLFLIPDPSIFILIKAPLTTPTSHPKLATIASRIKARPDPCLTLKPVRNTTECPSAKGQPQAILARNGHLSLCVGLPQPQALLAFCRGHPGLKPPWHATDTCPSVVGTSQPQVFWPSARDTPASSHLGTQRTLVPLWGLPNHKSLGLLPGTPRLQTILARNGPLFLCGGSPA